MREEFVIVKCDHLGGGGCGVWWLEGRGTIYLKCPRCGGPTASGYIIVNDRDVPDVRRLDGDDVMVVDSGVVV